MGRGGGEEEEGGDLEVGIGCSSKMHGMKGVALSILRGVILRRVLGNIHTKMLPKSPVQFPSLLKTNAAQSQTTADTFCQGSVLNTVLCVCE